MPAHFLKDIDDPRLAPYRQLNRANMVRGSGRFIAEGLFVVERLIASRFPIESVLLTETRFERLRDQLPVNETDIYVVPRSMIQPIIGFDFHGGILACGVRQPSYRLEQLLPADQRPITLVCCPRTADPVNLGNIIRHCCAFGVAGLLLGSGCADAFSRRVIRVSMGNVFRLPIVESDHLQHDLRLLKTDHGFQLAAMTLAPESIPLQAAIRPERLAILLGHEGQGLGAEQLEMCDLRWTIPMADGTDSLNVATSAAIALYQLQHVSPTPPCRSAASSRSPSFRNL